MLFSGNQNVLNSEVSELISEIVKYTNVAFKMSCLTEMSGDVLLNLTTSEMRTLL